MITDYASLQAEVINWLNRIGDTKLEVDVTTLIQLADTKFSRMDLQFERLEDFTISAASMPVPDDFRELTPQGMWFEGESRRYPIEVVSADRLIRYGTASGQPCAVAVGPNADTLLFAPVPSSPVVARIAYFVTHTPLSATVTTNDLLAEAPDAYLFCALAESAPYLHEDERVTLWDAKARQAYDDLKRFHKRRKWNGVTEVEGRLLGP